MSPTLAPGTLFMYDTKYYASHPVLPGDIVVLKNGGETWVKRIYGTPGKSFWAIKEQLDGRLVRTPISSSSRARFEALARRDRKHGQDVRVIRCRVLPDHVFVLGDGPTSVDSRVYGQIAVDQIVGRVIEPQGLEETYRPGNAEWKLPKKGAGLTFFTVGSQRT